MHLFMQLPYLIANYVSLHEQINNICTYIYQSCLRGKAERKKLKEEQTIIYCMRFSLLYIA